MSSKKRISGKTIERLAMYRRLLSGLMEKGLEHFYSHQLAEFTGNTAAQVRRDIMVTGYTANARRGYAIDELIKRIDATLSVPETQKIALVGIGNLGRAILSYFNNQHSALSIVAAFDTDESRVNRVIAGCRAYPLRELRERVASEGITLGIITVPGQHAQQVAEALASAGITGILNFAPVPLNLPDSVYTERIDITTAIEKVAYFANELNSADS
jgi:redox-sensing transcriptional repressor